MWTEYFLNSFTPRATSSRKIFDADVRHLLLHSKSQADKKPCFFRFTKLRQETSNYVPYELKAYRVGAFVLARKSFLNNDLYVYRVLTMLMVMGGRKDEPVNGLSFQDIMQHE